HRDDEGPRRSGRDRTTGLAQTRRAAGMNHSGTRHRAAGAMGRRLTPAGRQRGREVMADWRRLPDLSAGTPIPVGELETWPKAAEAGWFRPDDDRFLEPREILVVDDLSLHFGGVQALDQVRLSVRT